MIKDTIICLDHIDKDIIPLLMFYPEQDKSLLNDLILNPLKPNHRNLVESILVVPQKGDTMADRFTNSFSVSFNDYKLKSVIIIGSDTPHLQPSLITQCINILDDDSSKKSVLGPSQNDGFYLLGHNSPFIEKIGDIFNINSSYKELGNAMTILSKKTDKTYIMPEVTDIDTFNDLQTVRSIINLYSILFSTTSISIDCKKYFPKYTHEIILSLDHPFWRD